MKIIKMQNNPRKISIGIVTYNSKDVIKRCIKAVLAQTYKNFDIHILDNASSDGSADYVEKEFNELQVIRNNTNLGFGRAHNQLISISTGSYYLPLNPDIILSPDFIENMVEVIEQKEDIGWVSGKIYFTQTKNENPLIYSLGHGIIKDGRGFNIGYKMTDYQDSDHKREIFGASGAAPLYKKEMLEDLKKRTGDYFDEVIFLDLEDVDLDWRARLLGWKCMYTPKAVAHHIGGHSRKNVDDLTAFQSYANRYYIAFKNNWFLDVIFIVLPNYLLYSTLAFLLNPRKAFHIAKILHSRLQKIKKKRKILKPYINRTYKDMHAWFRWSKKQPAYHPAISIGHLGKTLKTIAHNK